MNRVTNKKPHFVNEAPYVHVLSAAPLDLVAIDLIHLESCSGGYEYILTIIDHFSRFAQTYALRNKEAKTVARHLFFDFMERFGAPARIMHDQGSEFENKLFHHLEGLTGVSRSRTTPYHPEGNGQCERMNKTLIGMLRTLEHTQKKNWKQYLNHVTHAYNCTRHSTTGFSPYFLMFGRHPLLPIDLLMKRVGAPQTHKDYAAKVQQQLEEAYAIVQANCSRSHNAVDERRERKPMLKPLMVRDKVLVRNLREKGGPGKLRSFWEDSVYEVVERIGDEGVVYKVRKFGRLNSEVRTVHRNLLLQCNEFVTVLHFSERTMK